MADIKICSMGIGIHGIEVGGESWGIVAWNPKRMGYDIAEFTTKGIVAKGILKASGNTYNFQYLENYEPTLKLVIPVNKRLFKKIMEEAVENVLKLDDGCDR